MENSKSFMSMRIVDIKKCIWVNNGSVRHYSFLNNRVDIVSILGIISDIEHQDGCIIFKYVFILKCLLLYLCYFSMLELMMVLLLFVVNR